jgi:hypothetical protein
LNPRYPCNPRSNEFTPEARRTLRGVNGLKSNIQQFGGGSNVKC